MGKILSLAMKPIRDFNFESRAHKVISREKPAPAPKYKVDLLELERIQRDHPEIIEENLKKDEMLNKRLKNVFVDSYDPAKLQKQPQNPNRPLPTSRTPAGDFEYGFHEPREVPPGRVTLKNALQFINNHQLDPKNYTSTKIALQYNLPEETSTS
ncbi:protein NDUFAF4 homolog isoform X2 [Agrilus planipennis]|uniref:Protein NDUFAF4 homolog isoform X2 n=1 Tax=Agrilus planipennis TaxID=224129 RepID=A0A1W4WHD1_AGRPL|nr:protein NDUFAF4 homolog isoform X2 [Agrilus planipennis]